MVTYYEDINYGKYNRSTDERFNDIDDIKEYALSIISEDYSADFTNTQIYTTSGYLRDLAVDFTVFS